MPLSRRGGWGLSVVLLSTASSAQSQSPSESPPPPTLERRELPPEARQRFEEIVQRVITRKPEFDAALEKAQALAARERAEGERLRKLEAEIDEHKRQLQALTLRLQAARKTSDEQYIRNLALMRRVREGDTFTPAEQREVAESKQHLRAMMADAERVQTLSQSLDRLVADYRRSVPAHYALKRQAIQARLQSAAAELVLIGADLELGKEEP